MAELLSENSETELDSSQLLLSALDSNIKHITPSSSSGSLRVRVADKESLKLEEEGFEAILYLWDRFLCAGQEVSSSWDWQLLVLVLDASIARSNLLEWHLI